MRSWTKIDFNEIDPNQYSVSLSLCTWNGKETVIEDTHSVGQLLKGTEDRWMFSTTGILEIDTVQSIIIKFHVEIINDWIKPDLEGNARKIIRDNQIKLHPPDPECPLVDGNGNPTGNTCATPWSMSDKGGNLTFDSLNDPANEEAATLAAAVFWYLWAWYRVDIALAERLANAYAKTYEFSRII